MTLLRSFVFCSILLVAPFASGQEAGEVQTALKQWVKTKQLISRESANWAEEQKTLADLNAVRKSEIAQLADFTKAAGSRIKEIDVKRRQFTEEEADLKSWRQDLGTKITSFEKDLRPLIPLFPAPLRAKVEEAIVRLETPDPDRPLQHRSRDVLLVLQAYLNFQNTITLDADIRSIDGEDREVQILYLGMTQAWYVDRSSNYSGYGVPAPGGWKWVEEPALAASVAEAIAIQTRRATPNFVKLPLINEAPATKK